jgi:hypothetical protein
VGATPVPRLAALISAVFRYSVRGTQRALSHSTPGRRIEDEESTRNYRAANQLRVAACGGGRLALPGLDCALLSACYSLTANDV